MIRRSNLRNSLRNRRFESLNLDNLIDNVKDILDKNGFEFYDRHQDGSWIEEFYINKEVWMTVYLSIDSSIDDSVYVKISSVPNDSVHFEIKNRNDLSKLQSNLW